MEAILKYLEMGLYPIPVPYKKKGPILKNWQNSVVTQRNVREYFPANKLSNIGILLGKSHLVDIDLDCPEAINLAPHYLLSTVTFGRESKRCSHYLYSCDDPGIPKKFDHPEYGVLLEYRTGNQQTIFPPSVHPDGEAIEWTNGDRNPEI